MATTTLLAAGIAGLCVGLVRASGWIRSAVALPVLLLLWLALEPLDSDDGALLFVLGCCAYGGFSALAQRPVGGRAPTSGG